MELTLYTEDYLNSAHRLVGYDGKCSELHGHAWKVCVWVKGEEAQKNSIGLLWDFNHLNKIIKDLDHAYLNEAIGMNPTVENLVSYIYQRLKAETPQLKFRLRIYESIVKKESYCEAGDF